LPQGTKKSKGGIGGDVMEQPRLWLLRKRHAYAPSHTNEAWWPPPSFLVPTISTTFDSQL